MKTPQKECLFPGGGDVFKKIFPYSVILYYEMSYLNPKYKIIYPCLTESFIFNDNIHEWLHNLENKNELDNYHRRIFS